MNFPFIPLNPHTVKANLPAKVYAEVASDIAVASQMYLLNPVAPVLPGNKWVRSNGKVTVVFDISAINGCKRTLGFLFSHEGQVKDIRSFLPTVLGHQTPNRFIIKIRDTKKILYDFQTFLYLQWKEKSVSPVIAVFDAEKHEPIAASAMDVAYVKYSSWAESKCEATKKQNKRLANELSIKNQQFDALLDETKGENGR